MRRMTEQSGDRPERSELRRFFDEVFRPNLVRDEASSTHLEIHSAAVEHLERFVKRPLAPADIDDELLLNFESYLWRQNLSDNRRRNLVESLRRIARAYTPAPTLTVNRRERRNLPTAPVGSLRNFHESVYIPQRLAGRSDDHIDQSGCVFYRLYEHFGRDVMAEEQTDALAAAHVVWLLDLGLSPASVNRHLSIWFATWRYAHQLDLVDKLPTLKKLPREYASPDAWTPAEIAALLDHADAASDRPIGPHAAGDWWRALIFVVWYTGIRRRAVLGLSPADLDTRTGWLRVPGKLMKNRRGQSFRLGPDGLAAVMEIWEPSRDLLFDWPYDRTWFYKQFWRIVEAAGVPKGRKNAGCLHKIRRSVGTAAAVAQGVGSAQAILGHSSLAMTERYIDRSKLPGHDYSTVLPPIKRKTPK